MRIFAFTCFFASLMILASGCTQQDAKPAAQQDTPEMTEEHTVMKPVVPDVQSADQDTKDAEDAKDTEDDKN